MFEFFATVTMVFGLMVMIGLLAVGMGYRGHLSAPAPLLCYFSRGVTLIAGAMSARLAYWDLFFTWLELHDRAKWEWWAQVTGGTNVNEVFHVPMMARVVYSLMALHLLLPEAERHRWRWWYACLYPIRLAIRRD